MQRLHCGCFLASFLLLWNLLGVAGCWSARPLNWWRFIVSVASRFAFVGFAFVVCLGSVACSMASKLLNLAVGHGNGQPEAIRGTLWSVSHNLPHTDNDYLWLHAVCAGHRERAERAEVACKVGERERERAQRTPSVTARKQPMCKQTQTKTNKQPTKQQLHFTSLLFSSLHFTSLHLATRHGRLVRIELRATHQRRDCLQDSA